MKQPILQESNNEILLNAKNQRRNLLKELQELGRAKGLSTLEQISNIYLTDKEFTSNPEFITPTLKLQRAKLSSFFTPIIKKLYDEGPLNI